MERLVTQEKQRKILKSAVAEKEEEWIRFHYIKSEGICL